MRIVLLAVVFAGLAGFASAEGGSAPDPAGAENGRYSMTPVADGFLRLDTRTGAVSLCKVENGAASCEAAAEERAALQDEIDRLARQNDALKGDGEWGGLPTRQELDRALDFAERFMRRMMRIMRNDDSLKDRT